MSDKHPAEALGKLGQKIRSGGSVFLSHGVVVDEDGAIYWVDGQGLYARVLLAGDPHDGTEVQAAVGGDLFSAAGGGLHSRPLRRGEDVLVALVEGDPRGSCVILSRVNTVASQPAKTVTFRTVDEGNVQRTAFDLLPDGCSWHVGLRNGDLFVRLEKTGELVFNLPGGAVFCFSQDGGGWKLRSPKGSVAQVTDDVVQLKCGQSFIDVSSSGITISSQGPVRINGSPLALNVSALGSPGAAAKMGLSGPAPSTNTLLGG